MDWEIVPTFFSPPPSHAPHAVASKSAAAGRIRLEFDIIEFLLAQIRLRGDTTRRERARKLLGYGSEYVRDVTSERAWRSAR
jgi:hypothetical protein